MSDVVFLAPHHDDEVLFGAFTLIAERPRVIVVFDGGPEREAESNAGALFLGCDVEHWRLPIDAPPVRVIAAIRHLDADRVYAPRPERKGGQAHHDLVGTVAAGGAWELVHYLTYTTDGKSTDGFKVPHRPEWVTLKLRALTCYPSQSSHPSHAPHFIRDQTEYVA